MRNKEDILIKDLLLEEMAKELLEQREFLRSAAKKNIETLQSENRKTYNRRRERKLCYTNKVRALDSRPEGMGSMPDAPRYPASTHGLHAEIVKVEIGNFTELIRSPGQWIFMPQKIDSGHVV
ncbi:hypothetical protein TNCV_660371 [Trichonephila clavipes]|nr:hypothetical protein TNCV_660371 [Trichonephila clavipes]